MLPSYHIEVKMSDLPILFPDNSNTHTVVYMIQTAHGPPEEPYPGAPIGIFYDYHSARMALDTYEHPLSSCFSDVRVMAFLTMSRVNIYGILSDTQICAHKTNKDLSPSPLTVWTTGT